MSVADTPLSGISIRSSHSRYGAVAKLFHWSTVALVGAAYLTSSGGSEEQIYSAASDFARKTHETLGLLLFALVLLRIFWRLFEPSPEAAPMPDWMRYSANAAHFGLYTLLLAIPLTALGGAWLGAHPLTLFGIGDVEPMLPQMRDLGQTIADLHTILGNVIIWLAGIHAIAALFHHYVLGDNTLRSMLPHWKPWGRGKR
jgi:cytochrome b561